MLVFPADDGTELTLDAFEKRWGKLKRATNEALAACEIPLAIEDLHFQDLRSMAGDDAEEQGQATDPLNCEVFGSAIWI